jgi:hypothetical protein
VFRRFVMRRGPGLLGRAAFGDAPQPFPSLPAQRSTSGMRAFDEPTVAAQDPGATTSRRYQVDQEALLAGPDADLSA